MYVMCALASWSLAAHGSGDVSVPPQPPWLSFHPTNGSFVPLMQLTDLVYDTAILCYVMLCCAVCAILCYMISNDVLTVLGHSLFITDSLLTVYGCTCTLTHTLTGVLLPGEGQQIDVVVDLNAATAVDVLKDPKKVFLLSAVTICSCIYIFYVCLQ